MTLVLVNLNDLTYQQLLEYASRLRREVRNSRGRKRAELSDLLQEAEHRILYLQYADKAR